MTDQRADRGEQARPDSGSSSDPETRVLRIAAVGDFHCGGHGQGNDLTDLFTDASRNADVLLLMGRTGEDRARGGGRSGPGGGFGRYALGTFGERETKAFVDAALAEELKLERALSELRTETRVVLLHYSPVEGTMGDEPPQIWPFLGSSRLVTPIEPTPAPERRARPDGSAAS